MPRLQERWWQSLLAHDPENPDITLIVHNNQIYGLTRAQASPTTELAEPGFPLRDVIAERLGPSASGVYFFDVHPYRPEALLAPFVVAEPPLYPPFIVVTAHGSNVMILDVGAKMYYTVAKSMETIRTTSS